MPNRKRSPPLLFILPFMLGTDIGPLDIGIDSEPPPTFAGPTGVTVSPVFASSAVTSGDSLTLV